MAELEVKDVAQAVIERMADCQDSRFKQVMSALAKHVHAFVQEVQLRPDEWMRTIEFLTAAGQMCNDKRQEFILLSDTLGVSMAVVGIEQAQGAAAALKAKPTALAPTPRENRLPAALWTFGRAMALSARFHTDAGGKACFWSIKPAYCPVPDDGPVVGMLRRMGRHPNRPEHMHTMLSAPVLSA
jgi:hydroxyquinol 1,2-dioxygenase